MPSTIEIQGVEQLQRKIGRMQTIAVLGPPMVRSMARLLRTAATYPARPASNQRRPYRRTKLLGRSWQMKVHNDGKTLEGTLNNPTPYGPYVMGPGPDAPKQAWMHVGTWHTTDKVVEMHKDDIIADFNRTIAEALR